MEFLISLQSRLYDEASPAADPFAMGGFSIVSFAYRAVGQRLIKKSKGKGRCNSGKEFSRMIVDYLSFLSVSVDLIMDKDLSQ